MLKWAFSYKAEAVVDASVTEVFAYLTNLRNLEEWVYTEITWVSEGPVGVGSTFGGIFWVNPYGREETPITYTVTQCDPNRRLAYEAVEKGGARVEWRFDLEPNSEGGTRILHTREMRRAGSDTALAAFALPFIAAYRLIRQWRLRGKLRSTEWWRELWEERAQEECPHFALVPKWDRIEDMGQLETVARYVCEGCNATFSSEERERLRSERGERLRRRGELSAERRQQAMAREAARRRSSGR